MHGQRLEPMEVDSVPNDDEDKVVEDQAGKLKDLAQKVQRFVEGKGTLEGAVFEESVFSSFFRCN